MSDIEPVSLFDALKWEAMQPFASNDQGERHCLNEFIRCNSMELLS